MCCKITHSVFFFLTKGYILYEIQLKLVVVVVVLDFWNPTNPLVGRWNAAGSIYNLKGIILQYQPLSTHPGAGYD
jgi:hypothetical protein